MSTTTTTTRPDDGCACCGMTSYANDEVVYPPLPQWYNKHVKYVMCDGGGDGGGGIPEGKFTIREAASGKCLFFDSTAEADGLWALRAAECNFADPEPKFLWSYATIDPEHEEAQYRGLENNGKHVDLPGAWEGYYTEEQEPPALIRGGPEQTSFPDQEILFEQLSTDETDGDKTLIWMRMGDTVWTYDGDSAAVEHAALADGPPTPQQTFVVYPSGRLPSAEAVLSADVRLDDAAQEAEQDEEYEIEEGAAEAEAAAVAAAEAAAADSVEALPVA